MPAHGVMFHHFHSAIHPAGQGSISGDELTRLIESLGPERILQRAISCGVPSMIN